MGSSKKADFKNQAYERHPFLMSVEETAQQLGTNLETGLTDAKVQELQQRYGRNQLEGDSGIKWYALLGKQISNAMIMVRTFFFLPLLLLTSLLAFLVHPCFRLVCDECSRHPGRRTFATLALCLPLGSVLLYGL